MLAGGSLELFARLRTTVRVMTHIPRDITSRCDAIARYPGWVLLTQPTLGGCVEMVIEV